MQIPVEHPEESQSILKEESINTKDEKEKSEEQPIEIMQEILKKCIKMISVRKKPKIVNKLMKIKHMTEDIRIVKFFESTPFSIARTTISEDALFNNYKHMLINTRKFLILQNTFQFQETKEKNEERTKTFQLSFNRFVSFFNGFYQMHQSCKCALCYFLIYQIIILREDDKEYVTYSQIMLKIVDHNNLAYFLYALINLMRSILLRRLYFTNCIERLLPILIKKQENTKKSKHRTLFNILFFKLLRLIFERIETFRNDNEMVLMAFLTYIGNFLHNICSSLLATQYLFIKCIDLMNLHYNQHCILIKRLSAQIILRIWNNHSLKLCVLKMQKPLIRFLMYSSNVKIINKSIWPYVVPEMGTVNQSKQRSSLIQYFKKHNKKNEKIQKRNENRNVNGTGAHKPFGVTNRYGKIPETKKKDQSATASDRRKVPELNMLNELCEYVVGNERTFSYFRMLLSHEEKKCLQFILDVNESHAMQPNHETNNNNHRNLYMHLFYSLYIQNNLENIIHQNKIIYYMEYLKSLTELPKNNKPDMFKRNMKIRGMQHLKTSVPLHEKLNRTLFEEALRKNPRDESGKHEQEETNKLIENKKMKVCNENSPLQANHDTPSFIKEQLMYDIHEMIKKSNCVMSEIYCSRIRLCLFFNTFFYKPYEINRIMLSSLALRTRKLMSSAEQGVVTLRCMNMNTLSHFLICKFLLKYVSEITSVQQKTNRLFFPRKYQWNKKNWENQLDFYHCYRFLEFSLKKDKVMTSVFLSFIHKSILHSPKTKRESMVFSFIITSTIYNFLTFLEKVGTHIEMLQSLSCNQISELIQKNCLIGFILKENNFSIYKDLVVTKIDDIYDYEMNHHFRIPPKGIHGEIYKLMNFKTCIFQKGTYQKIKGMMIFKNGVRNNFYTSQLLIFMYYSTIDLLVHFLMNIRFYYNMYHKTFKKSIHHQNDAEGYIIQKNCQFTFLDNAVEYNLLCNTQPHLLTALFYIEDMEIDIYRRKQQYIVNFFTEAEKEIMSNFMEHQSVTQSNKYITNLNYEKKWFQFLFRYHESSFFFLHCTFKFYNKTSKDATNATEQSISNSSVYVLTRVKNVPNFIDNMNNVIQYMIHQDKVIYKKLEYMVSDECNTPKRHFCLSFHCYTIHCHSLKGNLLDRNKERTCFFYNSLLEQQVERYSSHMYIFSYVNGKPHSDKSTLLLNELIDFIITTLIKCTYRKEKILYWSHFIIQLENYGLVHFHLFFYFSSLIRAFVVSKKMSRSHFENSQQRNTFDTLKSKIEICKELYLMYLFKISLLLNISIYEMFDFLISLATPWLNMPLFQFYLNNKLFSIEHERIDKVNQWFYNILKESEQRFPIQHPTHFFRAIREIGIYAFSHEKIKLLITKSYAFVNVLLHVLPIRILLIEYNQATCINIAQYEKEDENAPHEAKEAENKKRTMVNNDTYIAEIINKRHNTNNEMELNDFEKMSVSSGDEEQEESAFIQNLEYFHAEQNSEPKRNTKDKLWMNSFLKFLDYRTFLCFLKNKTDEEDLYEKTQKFLYFFFPHYLENDESLQIQQIDLIKSLLEKIPFSSMRENAYCAKWTLLRIYILQKFGYIQFSSSDICDFICRKINQIKETNPLVFDMQAQISYIPLDITNIEFMCNSAVSYITKIAFEWIRNHIAYFFKNNEQRNKKGTHHIQNERIKESKEKEHNLLYKRIYKDFTNFIMAFFPYLNHITYSYDIFLDLFKLYLLLRSIDNIQKGEHATLDAAHPSFLLFLSFVRQTHINIHVTHSFILNLKQQITDSDEFKFLNAVTATCSDLLYIIKQTTAMLIKNAHNEEFIYEDMKILYSASSVILLYQMFIK